MKFTYLIVGLLLSSQVFAGGAAGNGGGGWSLNGKVELLDIWEAANTDSVVPGGLTIPGNIMAGGALSKLRSFNGAFGRKVADVYNKISVPFNYATGTGFWLALKPGVSLPFPEDAYPEFIKTGWQPIGIASYNDTREQLYVDRVSLNAMDASSRDALFIHEAIYTVLRSRGAKDSRLTRVVVGYLFSNMPLPQKIIPSSFLPEQLNGTSNIALTFSGNFNSPSMIGYREYAVDTDLSTKVSFMITGMGSECKYHRVTMQKDTPVPMNTLIEYNLSDRSSTSQLVRFSGSSDLNCELSLSVYDFQGRRIDRYTMPTREVYQGSKSRYPVSLLELMRY